jgi:2-hydroxy-6-oxonona-2,4-dienedioate hydrolase
MLQNDRDPAIAAAAGTVAAIEGQARVIRTPCGPASRRGEMVWRSWGTGQPVVLLHGGSGSWNHWFKTIPALLQAGHEVIAADLPGLGDSALPEEPLVPASVAAAVMQGLTRTILPGRDRPHLVGFSFGGHIAGLTAQGLGGAFRDLTLVGVAALGLPHREGGPLAKYKSTMTPAEITGVDRRNLSTLMISDPGKVDALALHLHSDNLRKARFRSAPFAPGDELKRAIANVRIPLKTIWGRKDVIARPTLEARLAVLAEHHPELQARLIDDAGHWVMYEQGAAFNAALLELLPL